MLDACHITLQREDGFHLLDEGDSQLVQCSDLLLLHNLLSQDLLLIRQQHIVMQALLLQRRHHLQTRSK